VPSKARTELRFRNMVGVMEKTYEINPKRVNLL
jgi:hypothetical protein